MIELVEELLHGDDVARWFDSHANIFPSRAWNQLYLENMTVYFDISD